MFQRAKQVAGIGDADSEASLPYSVIAGASTNANTVKKGPGIVTSIHAINVNAAVRYLKFYDTKDALVAGAGTPVRRYAIPGNTTGAGFVLQPALPLRFMQGIAFTMTTGVADTDTSVLTANDVILTLEYV